MHLLDSVLRTCQLALQEGESFSRPPSTQPGGDDALRAGQTTQCRIHPCRIPLAGFHLQDSALEGYQQDSWPPHVKKKDDRAAVLS